MAEADRIFRASEKLVRISPEFDAPQFCRDWLVISPAEVRLTRIMVRGVKKGEDGKTVMRKGVAVMAWVPYAEGAAGQQKKLPTARVEPVAA